MFCMLQMGVRAIQRVTGLHQETILNILETTGQKAAAFQESKVNCVSEAVIQADEIHSLVYSKQRNTDENDMERGDLVIHVPVN